MKPLAVVAAILEDADGRILITQRPAGKRLAGFWEIPGGKIEPGESARVALRRELREELLVETEITAEFGSFRYTYDWGELDLNVFIGRALNEPRTTAETADLRWVRPSELNFDEICGADWEPLKAYQKVRE